MANWQTMTFVLLGILLTSLCTHFEFLKVKNERGRGKRQTKQTSMQCWKILINGSSEIELNEAGTFLSREGRFPPQCAQQYLFEFAQINSTQLYLQWNLGKKDKSVLHHYGAAPIVLSHSWSHHRQQVVWLVHLSSYLWYWNLTQQLSVQHLLGDLGTSDDLVGKSMLDLCLSRLFKEISQVQKINIEIINLCCAFAAASHQDSDLTSWHQDHHHPSCTGRYV